MLFSRIHRIDKERSEIGGCEARSEALGQRRAGTLANDSEGDGPPRLLERNQHPTLPRTSERGQVNYPRIICLLSKSLFKVSITELFVTVKPSFCDHISMSHKLKQGLPNSAPQTTGDPRIPIQSKCCANYRASEKFRNHC